MESPKYGEKRSFWRDDGGSVDLNTVGLLLSGGGFLLTAAAICQSSRSTKKLLERMNDTVKKIYKKSCLSLGAAYLGPASKDMPAEEYVRRIREASKLWESEV